MNKALLFFLLLNFLLAGNSSAQKKWTVQTVPNPKQQPSWNYISDPDNVLHNDDNINNYLKEIENTTGHQVAVVVLNSIGKKEPKDFATKLYRHWGIGSEQKNNGLLILLVMDQRRMEFEVGYGLESTLTDLLCKQIQEDYMVPYAKQGDYNNAVLNGVKAVHEILTGILVDVKSTDKPMHIMPEEKPADAMPLDGVPYAVAPDAYNAPQNEYTPSLLPKKRLDDISLIFVFLFSIILITAWRRRFFKNEPDYKNAQKGSLAYKVVRTIVIDVGIFIPLAYWLLPVHWLVGILFLYVFGLVYAVIAIIEIKYHIKKAAAGKERDEVYNLLRYAYLRWPNEIRYLYPIPFAYYFQPLKNKMNQLRNEPVFTKDGVKMKLLSEKADDKYLQSFQVAEESVSSVDYDVWYSGDGAHLKTYRYPALSTKYKECPNCKAITYKLTSDKTLKKSTYEREGIGERTYECMHCNYIHKMQYSKPKLQKSSGGSSSGSGSSRSSSSGGSSWGGGSSGGGGAGSSW